MHSESLLLEFEGDGPSGYDSFSTSPNIFVKTFIAPFANVLNATKGLALDVLPNEKLSTWSPIEKELFAEIAAYPATIFSPHVAGWTTESYYKINEVLLEKIKLHFSL